METIERKIEELLEKLDGLKECGGEARALPSESYFINADEIACLPRRFGDSRYPYSRDGLILWANASGNIRAEESDYTIFRDTTGGAEPDLCFYFWHKERWGIFSRIRDGSGEIRFRKRSGKIHGLHSRIGLLYRAKGRAHGRRARVYGRR